MPDRNRRTAALFGLPSVLAVGILSGCLDSSIRAGTGEAGPAAAIPEELLLDVGIAVFDAPDPSLDGDVDGSVFRNDEVLRAERNYVPYVIGEHLQAAETWGAVRVIPDLGPPSM